MADATNKIAIVTGAGTGVGRAASLALMNAGFTVVLAGRRMEMLEETKKLGDNVGKSLCVSADMTEPGLDRRPVRQGDGDLRPARRALQQCRHGRAAGQFRGSQPRAVAGGGEHQPHRPVPVHPARLPHHEGPEPARRPHHQQRLDLGARAAAVLRGLYLDQACHHRSHQGLQSRRPQVRYRGRPGRHRQRRDADDRSHGRRPRRDAARRHDETRAAHGREGGRRCGGLHGRPAARCQRAVHDGHGEQDAVRGTG